jgi:hypothetical protein
MCIDVGLLSQEMIRHEYVRVESLKRKLFMSTSLGAIEKRIETKQGEIQTVHKIVRAQAVMRGFIQRKRHGQTRSCETFPAFRTFLVFLTYHGVVKAAKRRSRIVMEILQTERAYVENLETMITVFYEPLMENALIDTPDVSFIFDSVRLIVKLNKELLAYVFHHNIMEIQKSITM